MTIRNNQSNEELKKLKDDYPRSSCHGVTLTKIPLFYVNGDNFNEVGKTWICDAREDNKWGNCFRPCSPFSGSQKTLAVFKNLPKDFTQDTWDSLKITGPHRSTRKGFGYYFFRNQKGVLMPWTEAIATSDQDKIAHEYKKANAYQPEYDL